MKRRVHITGKDLWNRNVTVFIEEIVYIVLNPNLHGGAYMPPLWFFGPGTHAIASIELKFSDFFHMVVGLLQKIDYFNVSLKTSRANKNLTQS